MSRYRRIVCGSCRTDSWHVAHGWCSGCYQRWWAAGAVPGANPPPPRRPGPSGLHTAARVEDYAELRGWGLTREQAAARLNVSVRTVYRYDRRLTAQGAA